MGRFIILLAVVAGCQSMYGQPSEPLLKVRKLPHPAVPEVDPLVVYVDDCPTNFHADPTGIAIDKSRASQLTVRGDTSIQQAKRLDNPTARAEVVRDAIDQYREALIKDPYNAEATLKLALAYDQVNRRGCALKLLGRIATLESHPKFRIAARRMVDWVTDTPEWFQRYRKDAMAILNGAAPRP